MLITGRNKSLKSIGFGFHNSKRAFQNRKLSLIFKPLLRKKQFKNEYKIEKFDQHIIHTLSTRYVQNLHKVLTNALKSSNQFILYKQNTTSK